MYNLANERQVVPVVERDVPPGEVVTNLIAVDNRSDAPQRLGETVETTIPGSLPPDPPTTTMPTAGAASAGQDGTAAEHQRWRKGGLRFALDRASGSPPHDRVLPVGPELVAKAAR